MRAELSALSGWRTEGPCLEFWRGTIAEASMMLCAAVCSCMWKGVVCGEGQAEEKKRVYRAHGAEEETQLQLEKSLQATTSSKLNVHFVNLNAYLILSLSGQSRCPN